jgi:diguanylate cyclase (GGDEF)-like protein
MLSYAASAEQRMAEQDERISFLEQLSVTDELTNIANRRGLRLALGRTLAASARHRETGVLGFLDMDSFKSINDTYGHLAGDTVLKFVAKTLKNHIRPEDTVARVSGDEFAILLSRCDADQGRARLRALQREINSSKVRYGTEQITIACSIGIHHFDGKTDPSQLIEAADKAMYHDKDTRKGRHLGCA